jgi:hypothetical protein
MQCNEPDLSVSRHSNVISNWYESPNLAGLFRTFTPRRDTTDMLSTASAAQDCKVKV